MKIFFSGSSVERLTVAGAIVAVPFLPLIVCVLRHATRADTSASVIWSSLALGPRRLTSRSRLRKVAALSRVVLSDFVPVSAGRMRKRERAVAGPLLRFDVRVRLDLQAPFDGFGVFFVSGFGIAKKSMAPDLKVVAVSFLMGRL